MRRHTLIPFVLVVALAAAGCGDDGPVAPTRLDVTGTWAGALPIRTPEGNDWSAAQVVLTQSDESATGEVASADGARYPVTGSVSRDGGTLTVGGLPGNSTCAGILLTIDPLEARGGRVVRLTGRANGRCFGTIAGTFELQRVG